MRHHHNVLVLVLLIACYSFTGLVASEEEKDEDRQRIDDIEWQGLQQQSFTNLTLPRNATCRSGHRRGGDDRSGLPPAAKYAY